MAGSSYSLIPGPPQVKRPSPEIYAAMGTENIVAMHEDFYERLAVSEVAHLFPKDQEGRVEAARNSALFFVELLGGPPLYREKNGPPMMRARHQPFSITDSARMEWLRCFGESLEVAPKRWGFPEEHIKEFKLWISAFSAWMVNTPEEGASDE